MWMPTADDQDVELMIPTNRTMEFVSVGIQFFRGCTSFCPLEQCIYCLTDDCRGTASFDISETTRGTNLGGNEVSTSDG